MVLAVFVRIVLGLLFLAWPGLCLAQSTPTEVWAQRYSGPPSGYGDDIGCRIARDTKGNIFVFGTASASTWTSEFVLIKYSGADGSVLWSQRYDSPRPWEQIGDLAVDSAGSVFITGSSYQNESEGNIYTAKYAGADGRLLWERRYDREGAFRDHACAIEIDAAGNAVIAGYSTEASHTDLYLAKYAGTNGALIWDRLYTNGNPTGILSPSAMVLDRAGDILVAGRSDRDAHIAKYSGTDGGLQWEVRPPHLEGHSLVTDPDGDLIVASRSFTYPFQPAMYDDIYVAKYRGSDGLLLWERRYNGPENAVDTPSCVALDRNGDVVVSGRSDFGNLLVAKFAGSNGMPIWNVRVRAEGREDYRRTSMAFDENADLIVTGIPSIASTAKISGATGAIIWDKRGSFEISSALILEPKGDIFVTGTGRGDIYTARYAASNGAQLWEKGHSVPAQSVNIGLATAIDAEGNVVASGLSGQHLYTAKYDAKSNGILWERSYTGGVAFYEPFEVPFGIRFEAAMVLDAAGNVIVSGIVAGERIVYLAKYAAPNGATSWEKLPGPSRISPSELALDQNGNVVVAGSIDDFYGGTDVYTAKHSGMDGALLWERRYSSPARYFDAARILEVDYVGNVIVSGVLKNHMPDTSAYTAKYAAVDGSLLWEKHLTNGTQIRLIQTDHRGDVVALQTRNYGQHLAKFDRDTGVLLWEQDTLRGVPESAALEIDSSGSIFISWGIRRSILVQKHSSSGALLWEKQCMQTTNENVLLARMTLGAMENPILLGTLKDGWGRPKDTFLACVATTDGALLWDLQKQDYIASSVTSDSKGALAVTGTADLDFVTFLFREEIPPFLRATRSSGESLRLSWPAAYSSWRLESQSDPLGLRPGSSWSPVAISPGTNGITLPVDRNTKAVFFRLSRP